jgi:hypothetical protein
MVTLSRQDVAGWGVAMDVFRVRDRLIDDYREFTGSFVDIHDKNIREHVAERMARGYQWPDPWLSLNPNFASGGMITDLIAEGLLHPECEKIFRLKDDNPHGPVLRLHQHQREAIEAARTGSSAPSRMPGWPQKTSASSCGPAVLPASRHSRTYWRTSSIRQSSRNGPSTRRS